MEINRCSDGGLPNPVEGSNSRNFALPDGRYQPLTSPQIAAPASGSRLRGFHCISHYLPKGWRIWENDLIDLLVPLEEAA
jgi:hypothetical protein